MVKKLCKKTSFFDIVNGMFMISLCITVLYPFFNTIAKSLSGENAIVSGNVFLFPVNFTLESYIQVLTSSAYHSALRVTIFITIVGTLLSLLSSTGAGYAVSRKIVGAEIIFFFLLVPKFFDGGMIPLFLQIRSLGLYDTVWALFLPTAFNVFHIILARNFFLGLPNDVLESAEIDGCSELQLFRKIVIPMSAPIIATLALFEAVALWNTYTAGIMYIDSISLQPLQVYVQNVISSSSLSLDSMSIAAQASGTENGVEGIQATVLIVSILPIICVYPFMQKYFVKGVNMGAVKG